MYFILENDWYTHHVYNNQEVRTFFLSWQNMRKMYFKISILLTIVYMGFQALSPIKQ